MEQDNTGLLLVYFGVFLRDIECSSSVSQICCKFDLFMTKWNVLYNTKGWRRFKRRATFFLFAFFFLKSFFLLLRQGRSTTDVCKELKCTVHNIIVLLQQNVISFIDWWRPWLSRRDGGKGNGGEGTGAVYNYGARVQLGWNMRQKWGISHIILIEEIKVK